MGGCVCQEELLEGQDARRVQGEALEEARQALAHAQHQAAAAQAHAAQHERAVLQARGCSCMHHCMQPLPELQACQMASCLACQNRPQATACPEMAGYGLAWT